MVLSFTTVKVYLSCGSFTVGVKVASPSESIHCKRRRVFMKNMALNYELVNYNRFKKFKCIGIKNLMTLLGVAFEAFQVSPAMFYVYQHHAVAMNGT